MSRSLRPQGRRVPAPAHDLVRAAPRRAAGVLAPRGALLCAALLAAASLAPPARGQTALVTDLETGVFSQNEQFVSLRYMRHLWIADDGDYLLVVQSGGNAGRGVSLYTSDDEGQTWDFELEVAQPETVVSDSLLLAGGDLAVVHSVTNPSATGDVVFTRLVHDAVQDQWSLDPASPVTVFASDFAEKGSRATLAEDSNGVLWCAFGVLEGFGSTYRLRALHSQDGGLTWQDGGQRFGTDNTSDQKAVRALGVNGRMVLVYQDVIGPAGDLDRFKAWAWRDDGQPLDAAWETDIVARMQSEGGDILGTHWSVASDPAGNLHMSYQDGSIKYLRYDAVAQEWADSLNLSFFLSGTYNCVSVAGNGDVYVLAKFSIFNRVYFRRWSAADQEWERWTKAANGWYFGSLRMVTPMRFDQRLPVLFQVGWFAPYQLYFGLFQN